MTFASTVLPSQRSASPQKEKEKNDKVPGKLGLLLFLKMTSHFIKIGCIFQTLLGKGKRAPTTYESVLYRRLLLFVYFQIIV